MSVHGLLRLHHAAQTQQARTDHALISQYITDKGHGEIAKKYAIPETGIGSNRIDKKIESMLRDAKSAGVTFPERIGTYFIRATDALK